MAHRRAAIEIGNRARHPQDPVIAPRRQAKAFRHPDQQRAPLCIWAGGGLQKAALQIRIHPRRGMALKPQSLPRPRRRHPRGHRGRCFARGRQVQIAIGHRRHLHPQIKAVHHRPRNPPQIFLAADRHPGTGARRVGHIAAFAGVRRRHQQKPRGIADMGIGPRHHHITRLNRLAQGFQHRAGKLREFVHEQNPIMRQRNLPRFRALATPHNRRHRGGVMRLAKRPRARNSTFRQQPRQRMDHRGFQRLHRRQGRQD